MYHRRSSNTDGTTSDITTATIENGLVESATTPSLFSSTSIDSIDDDITSSSYDIVRTSTSSSSLDRNFVVKTKRGRNKNQINNNNNNNNNNKKRQHQQINKTYRFFLILFGIILICIWGLVGTWMVIEIHHNNHHHHYPSSLSSFLSSSNHNQNKAGGSVVVHKQEQKQKPEFQLMSNDAPSCKRLSSPDEITVTLVTQVSYDRLWMMEYHCNRYSSQSQSQSKSNHHISIAVYTNNTYNEIIQELKQMDCNIVDGSVDNNDNNNNKNESQSRRPFVNVAILDARIHGSWNDYPVNELRNLALRAVHTTHILYIDVDFWPSEHLYETIMGNTTTTATGAGEETNSVSWSEARTALFNDPKQALVVSSLLFIVLFLQEVFLLYFQGFA
jgi:hypothetical protein